MIEYASTFVGEREIQGEKIPKTSIFAGSNHPFDQTKGITLNE